MSDFQFINFRRQDGRADLTLNNPPRNLLGVDMLEEILDALEQIRDDETLKILTIQGSNHNFCGGVAIEDLTAERIGNIMPLYSRLYVYLNDIQGLLLAVVEGEALGFGCELAGFCDVAVAADSARFGFPEITLGLFPPIATATLPRIIGRNRALDWIISGRELTASEAFEAHYITRVIPSSKVDDFITEYVNRINNFSAAAVVLAKRAVDGGLYTDVMNAIRTTESTYMLDLMNSIDPHEGLKAKLEGRAPVWKDR